MKHLTLTLSLSLLLLAPSAFSQDDDWYRPGGFDVNGRSYKTFSVSDTKKVHFSRGNLQYNAAQNKWRFALRQYNMICSDNANASETYDGWIDLFGWGTSGWSGSGANHYQPWEMSEDYEGYIVGGEYSNNLTDAYADADWGVYNRISNGGNKAGQWRTMTKVEWEYLLGDNAKRSGKWGFATINGVFKGLVVLPDEWTTPSSVTFTAGRQTGDNAYSTNTYSHAEWEKMQAAGAIFLPADGYRTSGTDVAYVNNWGNYWTSTACDDQFNACCYGFDRYNPMGTECSSRNFGMSVRLVADENPNVSKAFDLDGASYKTFSVADGRTVHFSKGNLRYNAATNTWAFASKQYLCIGEANSNISESYNGWIDLFGWGTSGWNSGATAFQPWSTSTTSTDYSPGGYDTVDLTGDYAQADWGVYNKITNGGNKAGKWRTLTYEEWEYLIDRSGKYGMATIGGTYKGMVLLPDDWTLPSGVTFTAGYGNGYSTNSYTTTQWQKMEAAGAIFLPAAAARYASTINDAGTYGFYYTSSHYNENSVWYIYFGESNVATQIQSRSYGRSVRLVKD